jgi:hypothetical protein
MRKHHLSSLIVGIAMMSGTGGTVAQETYVQSIKPYNAALARLCPEKHLENLFPGDFNVVVERFLHGLSRTDLSRWEKAAQPMCVGSVAGVSCANIAHVRAATKLGKTNALAGAACHSEYVCSAKYGECRTQP